MSKRLSLLNKDLVHAIEEKNLERTDDLLLYHFSCSKLYLQTYSFRNYVLTKQHKIREQGNTLAFLT